MNGRVTLTDAQFPAGSRVSFKVEVNADINVTSYVARQKANRFLILEVGDQFYAGEPELVLGPEVHWRVPVYYAPSRRGTLGIVGHLLVNTETGEITIDDNLTAEDLLERAEALLARATL